MTISPRITIPCFHESTSTTTAYIGVGKIAVTAEETTSFVKGRLEEFQKLKGEAFVHDFKGVDHLDVVDLKFDSVGRVVKFPVINASWGSAKLKKRQVTAKNDSAEKFAEGGLNISCVCGEEHLDFAVLDIGLQESGESKKLVKILCNYFEQIKSHMLMIYH